VAVRPVQRKRETERERNSSGGRERDRDGTSVYVTNQFSNTVSVIDTVTNTVTATIPVGAGPVGVAVTPDGSTVYVANFNQQGGDSFVSVIDTATNTVTATIPGFGPFGVGVTPVQRKREAERERDGSGGRERERDGSTAYVTNFNANTVSVIDTATNTVTATIPVGAGPTSLGLFIQPAPRFAGTPGKANCYGKSVSALVRQYKDLHAAAAALGFPSVRALQNAILAFCEGDR
jgi:YVTN family beta-propeller protein